MVGLGGKSFDTLRIIPTQVHIRFNKPNKDFSIVQNGSRIFYNVADNL